MLQVLLTVIRFSSKVLPCSVAGVPQENYLSYKAESRDIPQRSLQQLGKSFLLLEHLNVEASRSEDVVVLWRSLSTFAFLF